VNTPVRERKCARVAMPDLHKPVVVKRATLTIDLRGLRSLARSNGVSHDGAIPSGPLWCGVPRLVAVPQPSPVLDD